MTGDGDGLVETSKLENKQSGKIKKEKELNQKTLNQISRRNKTSNKVQYKNTEKWTQKNRSDLAAA